MSDEEQIPFSRKHGYRAKETQIRIREDAPGDFRAALLQISREAGLAPSDLRAVACRVLRKLPDPSNWSEYPNVWYEVQDLVLGCDWYRVYDIVEAIYASLEGRHTDVAERYEQEINEYFREAGIGWQLVHGSIQTRGSEAFESSLQNAAEALTEAYPTTSGELHEAVRDLSRRPEPDVTGAIQHAMAALECLAREATGDSRATLGDILKRYPYLLPRPLDEAVSKLWGYASETGRLRWTPLLRQGWGQNKRDSRWVLGSAHLWQ
ncbi:MAG: hypothetical protein Q8P22_05560 [Chloroflexota bacterium]|nr:hypothetical protein [Chloroflexota bacterium]